MGTKLRRNSGIIGLILLTAYVASYLPKRSAGSYRWTQTGQIRLGGISALTDLEQWSPDECWWQPGFKTVSGEFETRCDNWGTFYSPLIALDRRFNFPDRHVKLAGEFMKKQGF